MKRGEIYWAHLPPPLGRRPLLLLTRSRAIPYLSNVTAAEITTHVRGIPTEIRLGKAEGLPRRCVANVDNIQTVPKRALDPEPAGRLAGRRSRELDAALRFALGIKH